MALLFAIAISAVGLASSVTYWSTDVRREKEEELLFVGQDFRRAIALYYYRTPGPLKQYPRELDELLLDVRYVQPARYLRRIYTDPMTGLADWDTIRMPDGRIQGVRSRSKETPIKRSAFPIGFEHFEGAQRYSEWQFVFMPVESVHR